MRLSAQIKLAWLLPKPLKSAEKDGERERQRKTKKRKYHQAIKLRSSTHKKRVECRRRHIQYWNTNIVRGNVQHRYLWPRLALSGIQPQGCRAGPVGRASALRSALSAFSKMRRFLCVCVCVFALHPEVAAGLPVWVKRKLQVITAVSRKAATHQMSAWWACPGNAKAYNAFPPWQWQCFEHCTKAMINALLIWLSIEQQQV